VKVNIPQTAEKTRDTGTHNIFRLSLFLFAIFTLCLALPDIRADEINARSVVVIDAETQQVLFAKNPYLKRAPASTAKLVTAMVVLDHKGLQDVVTISRRASLVSPHKAGFRPGDRVTIENLLYAALLDSANDAAVALAEATSGSEARFVSLMNKKASAIGAKNTRFKNASGLPGKGQYTTAYDLSKIMRYALRSPVLKEIIGTRVAEISTEKGKDMFLKNSNKLLWSEDDIVGGKTGYTRKARHCFVGAAERNGDTLIFAILGSPNRGNLWKESEFLIAKGFRVIEKKETPSVYVTKKSHARGSQKKTSYRGTKGGAVKSDKKTRTYMKKKTKTKKVLKGRSREYKGCKVAEENSAGGNKG
jgi:D-alanyl-D-alanine carboxypeptidase (penicillin-binding protein 5/6)